MKTTYKHQGVINKMHKLMVNPGERYNACPNGISQKDWTDGIKKYIKDLKSRS